MEGALGWSREDGGASGLPKETAPELRSGERVGIHQGAKGREATGRQRQLWRHREKESVSATVGSWRGSGVLGPHPILGREAKSAGIPAESQQLGVVTT